MWCIRVEAFGKWVLLYGLNQLDVKPHWIYVHNLETLRPLVAPSLLSDATAQGLRVPKFCT